ncbi:MAG TPA: helix-turn-helix transcriptional regulator, partial [Kiloniellales bacterium]|nr:helix-turn-helix transcriptional regulator [Kiloniellales bacterium]
DLPLLLQQFLPGRERPSFLWMRGPLQRQMQLAARALTDPEPLDPSLLPTFIKAKASELLCLGLQAAHDLMGDGEESARCAPRYQAAAREARQLIDGSEGARLSIQELARRLRVDPTNLCAAFKTAVGETIFAYGNRVRMEKAQAMLADDRCSLKQISHALGFNQAASFSVAFKRYTGMTPDGYRRLMQRRMIALTR